jgi:hypothetical protein
LRDAAQSCVLSAEQLLQRTAAVLPTAVDAKSKTRLQAASGTAIEALIALCEAGKARARKPNAAAQQGVNDAASSVATKVNDVVAAAQEGACVRVMRSRDRAHTHTHTHTHDQVCRRRLRRSTLARISKSWPPTSSLSARARSSALLRCSWPSRRACAMPASMRLTRLLTLSWVCVRVLFLRVMCVCRCGQGDCERDGAAGRRRHQGTKGDQCCERVRVVRAHVDSDVVCAVVRRRKRTCTSQILRGPRQAQRMRSW